MKKLLMTTAVLCAFVAAAPVFAFSPQEPVKQDDMKKDDMKKDQPQS